MGLCPPGTTTDLRDDENGNLYISNSDRNGYIIIDKYGNIEIMANSDDRFGVIYETFKINSEWFSYFKRSEYVEFQSVMIPGKGILENMFRGQT